MWLLINLFTASILTFSSISLAQDVDYDSEIRVLKSAAMALHQYHPDISVKLVQYVHDRVQWRDETKVDRHEAEAEKAEMLTKSMRKAHVKLLKDAALLLQYSNPELSKTLLALGDEKVKKMAAVSSIEKNKLNHIKQE